MRKGLRLGLASRVVIVAALVGLVLISCAGVVLFQNARAAVAVETAASRKIVRGYVLAVMGTLLRDNPPAEALERLPGLLARPRHAQIAVLDRSGAILPGPELAPEAHHAAAPTWFARLLRPPAQQLIIPVRVGGRPYGQVMILADPSDEIDEIWDDLGTIALISAVAYAAGLLLLALVVRRALRPLRRMAEAFDRLESGDYAARIGPAGVPELEALAERFNRLGGALASTLAEKDALNRSLVTVQDAERKAVAMELHDEFGPCLFGLRVEATAILDRAAALGDEKIAAGARSMLSVVEEIQRTNRSLLRRLRPMEIGQLPLDRALDDLVGRMVEIGGETEWDVDISGTLGRYDETTELTIYRLTQEAITNALRHAGAGTIRVTVRPADARGGAVEVIVEDDGHGIAQPGRTDGRGLRGMRERAEAVGGALTLRPRPGGGTVVHALVPVAPGGALAPAEVDA